MKTNDAIAIVALSQATASKELAEAKGLIPEGCLATLELNAQIRGTLKRGKASEAKPTARLLNKAILAELIRRLGVTREAFKKHLLDIATESIVAGTTTSKAMEDASPELLLVLREVEKDVIAKLPMTTRAGSITVATQLEFSGYKVNVG